MLWRKNHSKLGDEMKLYMILASVALFLGVFLWIGMFATDIFDWIISGTIAFAAAFVASAWLMFTEPMRM